MAGFQTRDKLKNPAGKNSTPTLERVPLQKPVRFVTNNEEPQSKRRRISAACRTCQKRKIRCSGERPTCKTCLDSENQCQGYVEPIANHPKPSTSHHKSRKDGNGSSSSQKLPSTESSSPGKQQSSNRPADTISTDRPKKAQSIVEDAQGDLQRSKRDRKCVPFFRYFGPTAIVPGFKQMVVELHPDAATSPVTATASDKAKSAMGGSSEPSEYTRTGHSPIIPSYRRSDSGPVSPLIKDLCESFFKHLGCNYPFLTKKRFMKDLQDRNVEPILVDAVCAIAARFSMNPALRNAGNTKSDDGTDTTHRSKYGQTFARRAMTGLTETFACPNIAAVQACLLLAYEQFGSDRDSGLWVYLGLSIRMAQDLGMHKLEGLRFEGHLGPTPKTAKNGAAGKVEEQRRAQHFRHVQSRTYSDPDQEKEIRRIEKERIDTFWAVFFLDRVVSSGTGRPVSLRDKDIEISFPYQSEDMSDNEWPDPFPALIRIVHLYGRVANLLNNIREVHQVTHDTMQQLVAAEDDLIGIYQRLSPNLHFSAANFQHYLKHSQATNFVLLHFWFHTLIVLVHQPTLLDSFEGRIQQLFPNSIELSLSSAKTIADILSFAELLDSKSFIGNPFTSQPMYIAACAFLLEGAQHATTSTQSIASPYDRPPSPFTLTSMSPPMTTDDLYRDEAMNLREASEISYQSSEKDMTKESLLAAAASRNYQRCYKALKALETYWAGARYIVTVLDQKAKGSPDPLLYTAEDLQGAVKSRNPAALFGTPGWGEVPASTDRKSGLGIFERPSTLDKLKSAATPHGGSYINLKIDPSQAIGWSLAGSTNSHDSNLSLLYQTARDELPRSMSTLQGRPPPPQARTAASTADSEANFGAELMPRTSNSSISLMEGHGQPMSQGVSSHISGEHRGSPNAFSTISNLIPSLYMTAEPPTASPPTSNHPHFTSAGVGTPHTSPPLGYETTMNAPSTGPTTATPLDQILSQNARFTEQQRRAHVTGSEYFGTPPPLPRSNTQRSNSNAPSGGSPYSDMIIESQDVDTSGLGMEAMLWLDYMPQNALQLQQQQQQQANQNLSVGDTGMVSGDTMHAPHSIPEGSEMG